MEDDYMQDLVNQVRQEIIKKSKIPEEEKETGSIDMRCQFCEDGLIIDGFCYNCGQDMM